MKIMELNASDFPGIDVAKFNEWKALKIKKNHERRIYFYIGIVILLILAIVSILIAKPIFMLIIPILFLIECVDLFFFHRRRRRNRHLGQLGEELKMNARLRAKKKGEAFTG